MVLALSKGPEPPKKLVQFLFNLFLNVIGPQNRDSRRENSDHVCSRAVVVHVIICGLLFFLFLQCP